LRVVALYRPGPRWQHEVPVLEQPGMEGHFAHLAALNEDSRLAGAGAFGPLTERLGGPLVGMVVYRAESIDEAKTWAESDPAVESELMQVELLAWHTYREPPTSASAS
jgi:uncharacterized protein YciI